MDAIRNLLKNRWIGLGLAFLVGLIFGLVVLGWWLIPVEWKDATPAKLNSDYRQEYLEMAIQSYGVNPDAAKALQRFEDLGPDGKAILERLQTQPGALDPQVVVNFAAVVQASPATQPGAPATSTPGAEAGVVQPTPTPAKPAAPKSNPIWILIPVLCVLVLALGGIFFFIWWRNRQAQGGYKAGREPGPVTSVWTDYTGEENPPITQYVASYKLGDNLFDDSFSIDSPTGEFLGECGVGISETIGVGDPKKVTAFEVWLFDKNDIQTVTKVLMSTHAMEDLSIRQRLESKGEPVQVDLSGETVLETQSLRLVARIKDMSYGEGAMPSESFFETFVIELAVWQK